MRAAIVTETGGADTIRVDDLPIPVRGQTEAVVAVEAASVNPVDTYIRSGAWQTPIPFPFVVGRDLVGTVVEVDEASGFSPGDRVWTNSLGHNGRQGACAELAVVPTERLYRLPQGVDAVAAVAAFHPAATAFRGLRVRAHVGAGDVVLIGGAAGSVGSCAVLYATESGARVIATARRHDHDRCRALGASVVLDFEDGHLSARVGEAAPAGVDIFWDTSGSAVIDEVAPLVALGGRILVTAGRAKQPPFSLWPLYTKDVTLDGFVISHATVSELAAAARWINGRLAGDGFAVEVTHVVPLERAAEAHRLVESGVRGRVVILVRPQ